MVVGLGLGFLGGGVGIPFFEFFAVGGVFDVADHKCGEVAVFVGEDVD